MMKMMKQLFLAIGTAALVAIASCQTTGKSSAGQKREFIALLRTLPHEGDMFTEEAFAKASSFLPVMFDLTEEDIPDNDIYPFAAIIGGVCLREENKGYAVNYFSQISHPELQLFVGSVLFDKGWASPEIVKYLQTALENEDQANVLAEMTGPRFADFKKKVMKEKP